jgi:2-polyprenyl-3-methyl-5-hydroxy-6-metoxy-1,4-benzoquinol methylase
MMIMITGSEYDEHIKKESLFWDKMEEDSNKYGIPWWVDLRRAEKLSKVILGWMHDPRLEEILRGDPKKKMIGTATRKKGYALDIACGAGWLSLELARAGMHVDAYDLSPKRIEIAKNYLAKIGNTDGCGSINYQIADLNTISLEQGKYESVVAWDSLHHIMECERLVHEIYDSLKPGGYLIVFDHMDPDTINAKNKLAIDLIRLAFRPVKKVGQIFRKNRQEPMLVAAVMHDHTEATEAPFSPMENIMTGHDIISLIEKYFQIERFETTLGLMPVFAHRFVQLPESVQYAATKMAASIDNLLVKMRILHGLCILIVARKK